MGRVVINACYGGFHLSDLACEWLKEHGLEIESAYYPGLRHHPLLIQCVEELGERASDTFSELIIEEFEGDIYRICDYDGKEWVETPVSLGWININDF